ncbi:MAG: hypothetical protein EAZ51_01975 [Sphingobacteriales bacterium]|nr:MAG: hypothetical protein EAZ64_02640 [Sphingobacteriales bacterium]TAF82697.1 MAG: hypothetical protein EAZ51_01975 [Sphingobacteriales bacterium]
MKSKIITLLFIFIGVTSQAQIWEVGFTSGSMGYIGDLNQNNYLKISHLAFGGMIKNNIDGYWSVKLSVLSGQIGADMSKSNNPIEKERNLSFNTPITEASLQVEFNFFDYGRLFGKKRITPFLFTGLSGFTFNPKTTINNTTYELKNYRTEGQEANYRTSALAIPFGLGVKCNLTKNLNIIGEFGYRKAFTDYIDDVSGYYPNTNELANFTPLRMALSDRSINSSASPGSQRGDFRKNDTYLFAGITLSYTFVSQKCYSF